jgi:hypothetical protein
MVYLPSLSLSQSVAQPRSRSIVRLSIAFAASMTLRFAS